MKIAVIAANGRTGREFVKRALKSNHTVTAAIHLSNPFSENPKLKVIKCDVTNKDDIRKLIQSSDAVVSFIGHVKGSDPHIQTIAIKNTVVAMQEIGVKRIVSLTGTGVRFPNDHITYLDKFLNIIISIIDSERVKDGKDHVYVLQQSGLDWTVIRALKLQNTKQKPFQLLENGPTKLYVSRKDVAQAVLQVLEDNTFLQKAPILGKAELK